jgi:hypothetical protein
LKLICGEDAQKASQDFGKAALAISAVELGWSLRSGALVALE